MIPTIEHLRALRAQGFNLIPVWHERLADTETPVSAFLKLTAGEEPEHSFLLESVEGGERVARYSFIGRDPFLVFKSRGKAWSVSGESAREGEGEPLEALKAVVKGFRPADIPGLPPLSGAVGFHSYDSIRLFEKIPDTGESDYELDDLHYGFYNHGVVFDNRRHRVLVWSFACLHRGQTPEVALEEALARIRGLEERLDAPLASTALSVRREPGEVASNFTKEGFIDAVGRVKEYIKAGDAFQVVLSQRLSTDAGCSALDIYRMLRGINPSPYMFYLKFAGTEVAGASPEMLVGVQDGWCETRPIAGTRPRGRTTEEDIALERELLADPKERAEHLMLVDLGRNDIGRIAQYGTVRVEDFYAIERYSHVMHIVSSVKGRIDPRRDPLDALVACFPAGTLSGAPKIRAMQIIDELEPTRRGLYGGAVCYLDLRGNLTSCIVIRTVVVQDGKAFVQAGAGIVADSDPEAEYKETLHKASAVIQAIRAAHREGQQPGAIEASIAGDVP